MLCLSLIILFIVSKIKQTITKTKNITNYQIILKYSKGIFYYTEYKKQSKEYPRVFAGFPVVYENRVNESGIYKLNVDIT